MGGVREQQELAVLQWKVCRELSAIPRQVKAVTSPTRSQDAQRQARVKTGWETVVRIRHSPVVTQQDHRDEAGLRPSQDAKSASSGQGQTYGDVTRCKQSYCTAALWHRQGPAQRLGLKVSLKGKERQALATSFFHNCSYQRRSWPWTLPTELLQGGNVLRVMVVWGLQRSYGTRPTRG